MLKLNVTHDMVGLLQTACGRRNGFEYTVQMHMEASAMRLTLGSNDAATVHGVINEHVHPFSRARFNWVTEPGTKEYRIAAACGEFVASWSWRYAASVSSPLGPPTP